MDTITVAAILGIITGMVVGHVFETQIVTLAEKVRTDWTKLKAKVQLDWTNAISNVRKVIDYVKG